MLAVPDFHGSYCPGDVTFLLTPMAMPTLDVADKEAEIQSGRRHYSEMLSPEVAPSPAYMRLFKAAMDENGHKLAQHINTLANAIAARPAIGRLAIVSLARAGTPIGVLLTRGLRRRGIACEHYAVSIIRGRGIDRVALRHILAAHDAGDIVFVDGWTGKGAIAAELRGADGSRSAGITPFLAVVADPAGCADLAATTEDYVIPSGILGGIVSGLVSRSVLNARILPGMFHGCVRLEHLAPMDVSREFVDAIDTLTSAVAPQDRDIWTPALALACAAACHALLARIARDHGTADRNRIKPGIAEATRAVLRRTPRTLLLSDPADPNLRHLVLLAAERGVPIENLHDAGAYRAIAIIAEVAE